MNVGDIVQCRHSMEWQNERRESDAQKAKALGRDSFIGNAAAYMCPFSAYRVIGVTKKGGLRLQWFVLVVSPKDVEPSTRPLIGE